MIYYLCVSYLYATTLFVSILTVIQKVSNSHHTILSLYDFIISNLATLRIDTITERKSEKMNKIYGYCRISTIKQKLERQIDNIKKEYPSATIVEEKYTGTTFDRPVWNKLYKTIMQDIERGEHVTIIFDEVSRMSRNATEGFQLYEKLFYKGIELIFLKEPHLSTTVYRNALEDKITLTGTDIDVILKGINEYLMILAKKQIEIAFQMAQQEVDYLHKRTKEGVKKAQALGKQVGQKQGAKLHIKKKEPIKAEIQKKSKDFGGAMTDKDLIKVLGIARNTYYKYKKEMIVNE